MASGARRNAHLLHLRKEQRDTSPERTVVWSEPVNNGGKPKRVQVLYYLSRNGQLQHPHFMEVPLSSPQSLFLRDVLSRLNVLRGEGMAFMYSWSCKRSYKNGFVWHDLSENDFIYPVHGHEYVLKGSELPENSFLDSRRIGDSRRRNHSCSSIDLNYNAADASTQTDDTRLRLAEIVEEENHKEPHPADEIAISPPASDSSPETLETLLKADWRPTLSSVPHRIIKEHQNHRQGCRSSVLMQLISLPFKDCVAGPGMALAGQYKTRASDGGGRAEKGRRKLEEKEYFSGSLVETKKQEFHPALKRSTSYNADRSPHLELLEKEIEGVRAKCTPRKLESQSSTRKEGLQY